MKIAQIFDVKKNVYQWLYDKLSKRVPSVIKTYDQFPVWFKKSLATLPWIVILAMLISYFTPANTPPPVKKIQDPDVVLVNTDLQTRIVDGKVELAFFIEELRAPGRIDFNEQFLSRIGANVTGRVSEILAVPGQMVRAGDVLAQISSTELTQSQLSYLKSKAASQLADQASKRADILYKEDVIALAELQRRESEAVSARAEYRAANDQLRVQGMNQTSIDRLAKTGTIESINNVTATLAGEIVERKINRGQVVQPAEALFTVANLETLWAIAEVPESNAYLIRKGQKVTLIISALRNQEIEGVVSHIDSIVNPRTRTVVIRMELKNPDGQIKPGMLATMLIESRPVEKLVVPVSAVVREENQDFVFLRVQDNSFRITPVKLGPEGRGLRQVISGLKEGQEIALDGAYHLNTERKRQITGG